MASRKFSINFMGDVMLGRLIDQLFPTHVHEPSEAKIVQTFQNSTTALRNYNAKSPWGTTLPLLLAADLNICNLETSVTTHAVKWPDKVFNYRMHPENIGALSAARMDYAGLANNHTLDFSKEGLLETVRTVQKAGLAFAGAGLSREEALRPAILQLPRQSSQPGTTSASGKVFKLHIWAGSDHPDDWSSVPEFHLIDYSSATRLRLKTMFTSPPKDDPVALKIFSVHWGPNYAWKPAREIQSLAHFLIDECGIDIIHGHSSHHIQGVERYKGKLIIYGCGDFVDDYAVTKGYRNDLSAVWRVCVQEDAEKLKLHRLEVFPTRIERFQAQLLKSGDNDHEWVRSKLTSLCEGFHTPVTEKLGDQDQLIIDL